MLLHIVARGKIGRSPEADLVERYLKRIAWPTKVTELPDRGGKVPDPGAGAATVVLDERGKALSSMQLAKQLEGWRDGGKREARFLIGAADGHEEDQRGKADLLLSFGNNIVPGLNAPFSQTTICALGPSVMSHVVSLDRWFRDEIVERLTADAERRDVLKVAAG